MKPPDDLGSNSVGDPKWRFKSFFPEVSDDFVSRLHIFHKELMKVNSSLLFFPTRAETDADYTHFADCYLACKAIVAKDNKKTTYDLVGGYGIPGLILALLDPNRQVVVLDSDARRMEFISQIASKMGLSNVKTVVGKAEDQAENSIESAIIRGQLPITKCLLLMRKPIGPGGLVHHMKGNTWAREVGEIPSQICSFWKPELTGEYQLPISGTRLAVVTTIKR